jgi:hypothetical protein
MPENSFVIRNRGVFGIRLEPTSIFGEGSTYPTLELRCNVKIAPVSTEPHVNYTVIRLAGRLSFTERETIVRFESEPIALTSSQHFHEQQLILKAPLSVAQIKRIEEVRDGKDPQFSIVLSAVVVLHDNNEFQKLNDIQLYLDIPRSHWIDHVLKLWNVSDLRLLEIKVPTNNREDILGAQKKLAKAEHFYRTGDYPQVLTELRAAFGAIADLYGCKKADKNLFEKLLVNSHPKMREKLREAFHDFCAIQNVGAHEPSQAPDESVPPVTRHDARFALVTSHAIFEYFSSTNWPAL